MSDPLQRKPGAEAGAKAATSAQPMVEWAFDAPGTSALSPAPVPEPVPAPKPAQSPAPAAAAAPAGPAAVADAPTGPPTPPAQPPAPPAPPQGKQPGGEARQAPRGRVRVLAGVATVVLVAGATVGTLEVTGGNSSTQKAGEAANSSPLTILGLPTYSSASASPSAAKKTTTKPAAPKSVVTTATSKSGSSSQSGGLTAAEQAALASASPAGQHIAIVKNGSGSAYAFAVSGAHTLVYAYQSSTGPGGWTNFSTVPGSPNDLVSEPGAAVDKDGSVEVFARNADGQVVDGSQGSSGFSWSTVGSSLPGTAADDPAAILQPDGEISVFTRLTNGQVAMASQKAANGGGWSAWSSMGGDVSGTPVVYSDPDGTVDLFAISGSGTLVADIEAYGSFIGWNTLGSSPDNLAYDPMPVANQNGQTEVFVTTSDGNMDSVWGTGSGSSWTWGSPVTGENLGSGIASSPTGYAWGTDGHLEIFARLANGELAHAWQNEPNGETDWSLWGTLPGSPNGYPTAYMNGDGAPEVLMLTSSNEIEFDFWLTSTSAWSAPVVMPGDV